MHRTCAVSPQATPLGRRSNWTVSTANIRALMTSATHSAFLKPGLTAVGDKQLEPRQLADMVFLPQQMLPGLRTLQPLRVKRAQWPSFAGQGM